MHTGADDLHAMVLLALVKLIYETREWTASRWHLIVLV